MKKSISLILLLVLVFSLLGCGNGEQQAAGGEPAEFSVGYRRVNITPEERVGLGGYGNTAFRTLKNILDDLYATAVVFSDEQGSTVIMINTDLLRSYEQYNPAVQSRIEEATGVPAERVIITCNHSHSVPDLTYNDEATTRYVTMVYDRVVEAAVGAMEDRKPAKLYTGSIEAEGLNFVRHYWAENIYTGERVMIGDNFGDATNTRYVGHAGEADPTLHMIQIVREGCKDILFTNWRAHPHWTGGSVKYNLSSVYVGPFREALPLLADADVVYFQGSAGNINENSRISEENKTRDYKTYGSYLAEYAYECLNNNMTEVSTGEIKFLHVDYVSKIREKPDYTLVVKAKEVSALWQATGNHAQAMAVADSSEIHSVYHANAIGWLYSRKDTEQVLKLKAVAIGDAIGFVTFPGEAFDTISVAVEERSPYDFTVFLGYAVQHYGYMPNEAAWEYGCYEADITNYRKGEDKLIEDQYITMLEGLYNS